MGSACACQPEIEFVTKVEEKSDNIAPMKGLTKKDILSNIITRDIKLDFEFKK